MSLSLTHSQFSGISNNFSFSAILGNDLLRLIFFSLINCIFSFFIFFSNSLAGSSLESCLTSLPSIAYCKMDCFILSLKPLSIDFSRSYTFSYSSINGINFSIFNTIRFCSSKGGTGNMTSLRAAIEILG